MNISFELFPPATSNGIGKVVEIARQLADFQPDMISVTYGAGGSGRERSSRLVAELNKPGFPAITAHITLSGQSKQDVLQQMDEWQEHGVKRFVALRGDMPDMARPFKPHGDGFSSSLDLMAHLASHGAEEIYGGAYPEGHPESPSQSAELDHLKAKQDAGATALITQYFFEADCFLHFRDRAESHGITLPIIPGILPVANFEKAKGFSKRCGASIPQFVHDRFAGLHDNPHESALMGASLTAELVMELADEGVEHFHFYTLNRADLSLTACRMLGVRPT